MRPELSFLWHQPFFSGILEVEASPIGLFRMEYRPPQSVQSARALKVPWVQTYQQRIAAYLSGADELVDLPIDWSRIPGTPFRLQVWRELARVPYGHTLTYGELAQRLGRPGASRAVGTACAQNPLLLLIPCHRVLSRQGLGGFSGGGVAVKRRLLALEAQRAGASLLWHGMGASI